MSKSSHGPLRVGVGGPVGSGKTALVDTLCKRMRCDYQLGVVTNDIFTREDMEFLVRSEALSADRILGVQTGGCPHTAIREDASMNLDALDEMARRFPELDLVFIESGGDNLEVPQHVTLARPDHLTNLFRRFLDDQGTIGIDPLRAALLALLMLTEVAASSGPEAADGAATRLAGRADALIRTRFHEPLSTSSVARALHCNPD